MLKYKNKNILYLCCLAAFLGGFFVWPNFSQAAATDIVISEIMYDPAGSDTDNEWVEIYNTGADAVTIVDGSGADSWRFFDGSNHTFTLAQGSLTIAPGGAAILASNGAKFITDHAGYSGAVIDTVMSLNNTSDTLKLSADKGATFFGGITYQNTWSGGGDGKSLEKINLTGGNEQGNWQGSSADGGSPGTAATSSPAEPTPDTSQTTSPAPSSGGNASATEPAANGATVDPAKIKISEIYPNPATAGESEFIELWNSGHQTISLEGWKLGDSAKITTLGKISLVPGEFYALYDNTTKISLNNTKETIALYDANGRLIDKIDYSLTVKGQSLTFDVLKQVFVWSAQTTPNSYNIVAKANEPPQPRITFDYNPAAPGEEIIVSAEESTDPDDDPLTFSWRIGDSFQANGPRFAFKFPAPGAHLVSLVAGDGNSLRLATGSIDILPAAEVLELRRQKPVAPPPAAKKETPATSTPQTIAAKTTTKKGADTLPIQPSSSDPHPAKGGQAYLSLEGRGDFDGGLVDIDLANIRELELGNLVRVQGTVAVLPGIFGKTYFYITGSPGVQVYFSKSDWPKLALGDVVGVIGELTEASGETRLKISSKADVVPLYKGKPPAPGDAETGEISEGLEGALIKTAGELLEKKGNYWLLDDGSGEIRVTFQTNAKITKPTAKAGDWIEVIGLVSETKTGYRLLPRSTDDIKKIEPPQETEALDEAGQILGETTSARPDSLQRFRIPANNQPQQLLKYLLITSLALIILLAGLLIKFRMESKKRNK